MWRSYRNRRRRDCLILANSITSGCLRQLSTAGILLAGQMPQHQILPAILILAGIGAVCYLHPAKKRMRDISIASFRCCAIRVWIDTASAMQYTKTGFTGRTAHGNIGSISGILTQKRTKNLTNIYIKSNKRIWRQIKRPCFWAIFYYIQQKTTVLSEQYLPLKENWTFFYLQGMKAILTLLLIISK